MNRKFLTKRNERGQGLVEYTLVAILIAIPLIGGLTLFGPEIKVIANNLTCAVSGGFTVQDGVLVPCPSSTPVDPSDPSETAAPAATATSVPTFTSAPASTSAPAFTSVPASTSTQTTTSSPISTLTLTSILTRTATATLTTTSTPTTTLTPTATPIDAWVTCANENGFCSFSGTTQVRYGANSVWVTQTFTDGVSCTNTVFGDPISGVVKTCQYYQITVVPPTYTPTLTPVPQWVDCAAQNGFCSFTGTYAVRFGRNSTWVTQIHTDGVACTTAIFGNPTWGTKKCQVYK